MKDTETFRIRWLYRRLRPMIGLSTAAIGLILTGSAASLVDPLIMKRLVDGVINSPSIGALIAAGAMLFVVRMLRLGSVCLSGYLTVWTSERLALALRKELLRSVHRWGLQRFERKLPADLMFRLEQDVNEVCAMTGGFLGSLLQTVFTAVFILVSLAMLDYKLALALAPFLTLFIVTRRLYHHRLASSSMAVQQASAARTGAAQEAFLGFLQWRSLGCHHLLQRRFWKLARVAYGSQLSRSKREFMLAGLSMSIGLFAFAGSVTLGGYHVITHQITAGTLVAFYAYLTRLLDPLSYTLDVQNRLVRGTASLDRLIEISLREPGDPAPQLHLAAGGRFAEPASPRLLDVRAVSFAYAPGTARGQMLLRSIELAVEPGERVAIMGASGCGKSTLAKVMAGLYVPFSGTVNASGEDLARMTPALRPRHVLLVPQDTMLLSGTIRDNLLCCRPRAAARDLDWAIGVTRLERILSGSRSGLDEIIGPAGRILSGGERQRLAIARALLGRPRVLILDESTSALDPETETDVLSMLSEECPSMGIILVSHRRSVIGHCTSAYRLKDGVLLDDSIGQANSTAIEATLGGDYVHPAAFSA
jgi:ABC-type bacteriocin/lantibiotic exporter with double-glycine peptidase domain